MGLREIQEGSYEVGESAKADLSSGLREGSWDYASLGAARAVDWSADLSATRTREEVRASMPESLDGPQPSNPATEGGPSAPAAETFNGEPVPDRPFDLGGLASQKPAYAGNAAVAAQSPAVVAATEQADAATTAYEAQGAASAVREVSSAAAAVHAVDAAKTARAQYKSAGEVGAASAVDVADASSGGAAAVASAKAVKTSDALSKPAGQVSAAESALESGARATKLSKLKSGALKGAGIAAELAGGQDIGEGMANVAEGEAKGFAERKAAGWAAKRMRGAKAARAARKAAKAAGNAGAAKSGAEAAGAKAAGAAAKAGAAAAAEPAAQAGFVRRAGAKLLAKARSLFKPLPPISYLADKAVGALFSVLPAVGPFFIGIVLLAALIAPVAMVVAVIAEHEAPSAGSLSGNEAALAQLLKERDLDDLHVAAIMGNFACESSCNPKVVQYGFGYDGIDQDDYPPELIDNGQCGYGLAQWTYPSRCWGLVNYAASVGKHSGDMEVQVDWFMIEYARTMDSFKMRDDIDSATRYFHETYEQSNDSEERIKNRVLQAKRIYAALTNSSSAGGQDYDSATARQRAMADAASCGDTYGTGGGWCEAWAENVYRASIGPCSYMPCASEACWIWRVSEDKSSVPVGAAVFGHSTGGAMDGDHDAGHVAIYVGDGKVIGREASGDPLPVRTLDEWTSIFGWYGWGWINGDDLSS